MNKAFMFDVDDGCQDSVEAPAQTPWEFSGYSLTVAQEHLKRRTTSIDHKISEARLKTGQHQEVLAQGSQARRRRTQFIRQNGNPHTAVGDCESEEDDAHVTGHDEIDEAESEDLQVAEVDASDEENDSERNDGSEENGGEYNTKVQTGDEAADDSGEDSEGTEKEPGDSAEEGEETQYRTTKNSSKSLAVVRGESKESTKITEKFFSSVEGITFNAKTFMELHISRPLLRACHALGYKQPTPIQAACIPLALTGRDICGSAVTGSGKTAAFALPLLERLLFRPRRVPGIRVLILTPTRELAVQVHSMIEKLAQFTDIRCCLVVGGLSSKVQEVALRSQPDIVIATPGRMIDHLHNTQSVGLEDLAILILDEADRLLELGFSNEVQELVRLSPKRRQTMLFSATLTEEIDELVKLSLSDPVRLSADPSTQRPATLLEQVIRIRPQHEADKEAVLLALCSRSFTSKAIIFSGTKVEAHRLKILFGLSGLKAAELHGNLTQVQRLDALDLFRKREVDFLIATDVAARGLDIVGVETVINFECPRNITTYVHRVGRTARAGQQGCAVTFVCEKDHYLVKSVAKRAGSRLGSRVVPAGAIMKWHDKIEGFEEAVNEIFQEERAERALRKAEMEANKAQNLMDHESEIFSRPKRIWFQTVKEKRQIANAAKVAKSDTCDFGKGKESGNIEKAVKIRTGKRSLEGEKNMTRKKRRRLEALKEASDEYSHDDENVTGQESKKRRDKVSINQRGSTTAELAYRKAKGVKASEKARESGNVRRRKLGADKSRSKPHREKNRKVEMQELFQGDVSESKSKNQYSRRGASGNANRKPGVSKRKFKSKARYKRK